MLALVLVVAFSLGLSNVAAAVGMGVVGVDARTRVRVGVAFGIFEAGMPILGLALGHSLASALGQRRALGRRWPADRHWRVRANPGVAGRRHSTWLG